MNNLCVGGEESLRFCTVAQHVVLLIYISDFVL